MFAKKDIATEVSANSYLYEIFRLNPEFSDVYTSVTHGESDAEITMQDFLARHKPASPFMAQLENTLAPYLATQEALAVSKIKYTQAIEEAAKADAIDQLTSDERHAIDAAKAALPNIVNSLQELEKQFQSERDTMFEQIGNLVNDLQTIEHEFYENKRERVYEMLDKLSISRDQFQDKTIDNPLRFTSYQEAYDYMERQTAIDRTRIPIKNWQQAEHNYDVFQQLIIYLALIDCLLPLGIDYGS